MNVEFGPMEQTAVLGFSEGLAQKQEDIVRAIVLDFSARQTALETVYGAPPQVFLPFLVEPEQQQIALDAAAFDKMTARYISYFREKEKGEQPF